MIADTSLDEPQASNSHKYDIIANLVTPTLTVVPAGMIIKLILTWPIISSLGGLLLTIL